jgi:hypothetical protein
MWLILDSNSLGISRRSSNVKGVDEHIILFDWRSWGGARCTSGCRASLRKREPTKAFLKVNQILSKRLNGYVTGQFCLVVDFDER